MENFKLHRKKEKMIKKETKALLQRSGFSLVLFLIVFDFIKDVVLIPVLSKIWSLTLMTTPEGYISNANIMQALIKSPWIVVVGLLLITAYAIVSIWQVCALFLGLAYTYQGKKFKIIDLFRISVKEVLISCKPENWMLLVYTLVVVPFADMYQTSDMVGAFVIPEYISDFIYANRLLSLLLLVLSIFVVYLAMRWFYLLPSFVLNNHTFKSASHESFSITKKGYIKKSLSLAWYNITTTIRYSIETFAIIYGLGAICYFATSKIEMAKDLFIFVFVSTGAEMAKDLVGSFVYICILGYLFISYVNQAGMKDNFDGLELPTLKREAAKTRSFTLIRIVLSVCDALLIAFVYLLFVFASKVSPETLSEYFTKTNIVAHKGYSSEAPENTMPAFDLADKCENVDFIELDVWSSKDGIPVVIHNKSIKDATGIDGEICDFTYEELQHLPACYSMSEEEFKEARIPSLEEVLAEYADTTPILIEIKGYSVDEQLPAKIVNLMDKYNCKSTSMIHSGDYQALKAVKECDPDIECGLIQAVVAGNCYDLPYADFMSVEHTFVNSNMISQLHLRGKKLYVWTVNFESSADNLNLMGVDGIITDYPDKIADILESQNAVFGDLTALKFDNDISIKDSEFENGDY